jgi:hypothetical protein
MELFTKKVVTKISKIWVWDPGSGIRDPGSGINPFRIPDPGVKEAPDPGSGSATLQKNARWTAKAANMTIQEELSANQNDAWTCPQPFYMEDWTQRAK